MRLLFQSIASSFVNSCYSFGNASSAPGFFQQQPRFRFLLLQPLHNIGRRFGQKAFIPQLALCGGQPFSYFAISLVKRSRSAATSMVRS